MTTNLQNGDTVPDFVLPDVRGPESYGEMMRLLTEEKGEIKVLVESGGL